MKPLFDFYRKKTWVILCAAVLLAVIAAIGVFHICRVKKDRETLLANQAAFQKYYDDKIALYSSENSSAVGCDVVFIGDSLTDLYPISEYYPQFRAFNRGIGGDTTVGLEKRLQVSVLDVRPRAVVMLIGANNMDTMMENYERILQRLDAALPDSEIVLLSLTAMGGDWARKNDLAVVNNQKIKLLAGKYGFSFVDLFTPLCNAEDGEIFDDYTTDGGHLTPAGYRVVTDVVTPVLEALLNP